jgi:hypothetical protein
MASPKIEDIIEQLLLITIMRTLLPIWEVYKTTCPINVKELPENFDWIANEEIRTDFIKARDALDRIPGSRIFLKNYTYSEGSMPFFDRISSDIIASFGDHHSGSSAISLGWTYKFLLNNWDAFVENSKEGYARKDYDAIQILENDTWPYFNAKTRYSLLSNPYEPDSQNSLKGEVDYEIEQLRQKFSIPYDNDKMSAMLDELIDEISRERAIKSQKKIEDKFKAEIRILKHHYKFPDRWNDTPSGSSLFGSPRDITYEMICEMEKEYPDYREHIENIRSSF